MDYENEVEIDLFRMLFKACRKWRLIVVLAILLAIVVGGVKTALNIASIRDPEALEKVNNDYETKKTAYETEGKNLETSIDENSRNLQILKEYNDNSLLMKIDPYNEWIGSVNLYVDTHYQVMPGTTIQNENPAYKIVCAYSDYVVGGDFYQTLQKKLDFEVSDTKYLKEIISVGVDGSRYAITIRAVADTQEHCNSLLSVAKEIMVGKQKDIKRQIDEHDLTATEVNVYSQINTDREKFQIAQRKQETELEVKVSDYRMDYLDWKEREKELETPILDMGHAVKNGVKFFLIGGFVSGLALGVCFCMGYIFSGKVQGPESMPKALRLIGEIPAKKTQKLNAIDRMFFRMFGVIARSEERDARVAACAQYILQLFENLSANGKDKKIAFVSDMPIAELKALAGEIREDVKEQIIPLAAGNSLMSAEALQTAVSASAVVLVAKQGASVKRTMEGLTEQLKSCGVELLGVIVTDTDAQ